MEDSFSLAGFCCLQFFDWSGCMNFSVEICGFVAPVKARIERLELSDGHQGGSATIQETSLMGILCDCAKMPKVLKIPHESHVSNWPMFFSRCC